MTQAQRIVLVVLAFLAGCGGSQVARVLVPVARADTNVQRWEYACREQRENVTAIANEFGAAGWEMTAAAGAGWGSGLTQGYKMIWCFKRPLP